MATELATGMAMFAPDINDLDAWISSVRDSIIEPGLALKEKIMCSRQEFELVFITNPPADYENGTKSQLKFEWEEYQDITDNHRRLDAKKMDDSKLITMLGTTRPCFYTRLMQDHSEWREPKILVKQSRLVALKEDLEQYTSKETEQESALWSQFVGATAKGNPTP
ncbi:hypothetical protein PG994_009345 [Apiospora phragmitis]|uniref:PH domain-containing protein n=1 Tax=Apiospora phragmitis TaxID=2905665 RepID=A0ABR1UJK8_9PEZI